MGKGSGENSWFEQLPEKSYLAKKIIFSLSYRVFARFWEHMSQGRAPRRNGSPVVLPSQAVLPCTERGNAKPAGACRENLFVPGFAPSVDGGRWVPFPQQLLSLPMLLCSHRAGLLAAGHNPGFKTGFPAL